MDPLGLVTLGVDVSIFSIVFGGSFTPKKMFQTHVSEMHQTGTTPDQWHSSHKAGRTRWGDRHASCLPG